MHNEWWMTWSCPWCPVVIKEGNTLTLMAEVCFKRPVQVLGDKVGVAVVHLNNNVAKQERGTARVYKEFWDALAEDIKANDIKILGGDFNMALCSVVSECRSRGITADLAAWYPYWLRSNHANQKLHLDSCGIFVIGGNVVVQMPWAINDLPLLSTSENDDPNKKLDEYDQHSPGQHWEAYRPKGKSIPELLTPLLTTSYTGDALKGEAWTYREFLRVKQKPMDRSIWEYEGHIHQGAHFPLVIMTVGRSHRSNDKQQARYDKYKTCKRDKSDSTEQSWHARSWSHKPSWSWYARSWSDKRSWSARSWYSNAGSDKWTQDKRSAAADSTASDPSAVADSTSHAQTRMWYSGGTLSFSDDCNSDYEYFPIA